jgi:hypothetical protein
MELRGDTERAKRAAEAAAKLFGATESAPSEPSPKANETPAPARARKSASKRRNRSS